MIRLLFILALVSLIPVLSYGAHVLIWEYDTLDIFYDPVLADSVSCPYQIEKALINKGHTFEIYPYLPLNLSTYDVVFVTLG